MKEKLTLIQNEYTTFLREKGYNENKPVKITSGVDKSVVLVGSTISVLKPKLLNNSIHKNGEFLFQRAIRTQPLKVMTVNQTSEWSSYFDATGLLVPQNLGEKLVYDVLFFLINKLNLSKDDNMIRINCNDTDLMRIVKNVSDMCNVEMNTREEKYYKHRYGLDEYGIYGRNFNIALKDKKACEYKDIGNIIIIENQNKKFGIECAIGLNALLMRMEGLKTSIEASSISDIVKLKSPPQHKFADCLSVVSHLAYENVEGLKKRNPIYLYRKYLKYLEYWSEELNLKREDVIAMIKNYLKMEYNNYDEVVIENNLKKLLIRR